MAFTREPQGIDGLRYEFVQLATGSWIFSKQAFAIGVQEGSIRQGS